MAKNGINRDVAEVFLSEISRHGSIRKACKIAGVDRRWLREKKLEDDFAERYADAQEDAADRLEDQARDEALDGSEKLLVYLLDVKRYKKAESGPMSGITPTVTITIGGA